MTMTLGDGFVGRDVLAADLRRALDGTPGRGSVVIVRGGPGIGKTRLVQEVTSDRRALWGRASSDDRSGTLEPWRRVLRAAGRADIDLDSDALAIAKADASAPADASLRLEDSKGVKEVPLGPRAIEMPFQCVLWRISATICLVQRCRADSVCRGEPPPYAFAKPLAWCTESREAWSARSSPPKGSDVGVRADHRQYAGLVAAWKRLRANEGS
jgi:AAA ATPase domain